MKKLLVLLAGTLAIAGAAPAVSQSVPTATQTVRITATGFAPDSVVIQRGDTVTWVNNDSQPHQIVSDTNAFPASPVLEQGEAYSHRFLTAASYTYHDGRKPSSTGVVHVRGARVTISLSRLFLVYRNPVQVSGTVPNGRPNEIVTVTITRYGGQQESRTFSTDSDGIWRFIDRPRIRTEYKATWRDEGSAQVPHVNVRPLVVFRILSARANRYRVIVAAQRSYARRTVFLQRRTRRGAFVSIRRVRLNARGQARFRANVPQGRSVLRMWVGRAPGYIAGFSVVKSVSR
jgi:plastocyanin